MPDAETPSAPVVTLRSLAEQLGVHPSTVSRVLNEDPSIRISEATRAQILSLAAESGYRPNRLARALRMQRTNLVGFVIPDISNPLFASLFRAAEAAASAQGQHVILCDTDDNAGTLERELRALSEGHVDGVIIAAAQVEEPALDLLRARSLPFVQLLRYRNAPSDSWVAPDDAGGARLAVAHLAALGHRRFALVGGSGRVSRGANRRRGFVEAVTAVGGSYEEWFPPAGGLDELAGEEFAAHLLAQPGKLRPTAVVAANDLTAIGIIAAVRRAGLRVPDDLSVVGSDDIGTSRYLDPPLTSVQLPLAELGRRAVDLLGVAMQRQSLIDSGPTQILLPVQLAVRGSTGSVGSR
jgi:LacI family transcriptional regulator